MVSKPSPDDYLNFMSEGLIVIDDNFSIIKVNKVICNWVNSEQDKLTNRDLFSVFPELECKKFHQRLKKLYVLNAPIILSSLIHKSFIDVTVSGGDRMIQETSIYPSVKDGAKYAVITIKDVTEHAKSLQMIKQSSDQVKALANAKLNFLSSISHDIRTPLNGIIGSSDLLRDTNLTETQTELADIITNSSRFLLSLINDFLDLSKIESNKFNIEPKEFQLMPVINEIIAIFEGTTKSSPVDFITKINFSNDYIFNFDEIRLKQILINLISNAFKFTTKGNVTLTIDQVVDGVEIIVSDTGKGVPEDDQRLIFESFSQVSRENRGDSEGTGLGLSIVKSIVESTNGTIKLESELSKGTKVFIRLPNITSGANPQLAKAPVLSKEEVNNIKFTGKKVLVAEDNFVNQTIIRKFLEKLGMEIVMTKDGQEAIDEFNAQAFDIVLLDYLMPKKDGVEVAKEIKEQARSKNIKLVVVSANALNEHNNLFLETGFDHILSKPYTYEEFASTIHQALTS